MRIQLIYLRLQLRMYNVQRKKARVNAGPDDELGQLNMAGTRSTIAIESSTGTIQQVLCKWDGQVDRVGRTLQENYNDLEKVNHLLSMGSIHQLGASIGEKHPFQIYARYGTQEYTDAIIARRKVSTFYARDLEDYDHTEGSKEFTNFSEYRADKTAEYRYIFRKGVWYVSCPLTEFKYLTVKEALEWWAAVDD